MTDSTPVLSHTRCACGALGCHDPRYRHVCPFCGRAVILGRPS